MYRHPILDEASYLALYRRGAPEQWSGGATRRDFEVIREVLAECTAGHILDVGCGAGDFLASLPSSFEKFGVEPSAAASLARSRGVKVLAGAWEALPQGACFDVITVIDVIEHMADVGGMLDGLVTHLNPDGMLIVSTGDPDAWAWRRVFRSRFWYVAFPEHLSFPAGVYFDAWAARHGGVTVSRRRIHYHALGARARAIAWLIQLAYWASPSLFDWLGRRVRPEARASRGDDSPRRRHFAPGVPGLFADHQVVVIRKGSMTSTPAAMKGAVSRVATMNP